ncbi:hypothetical protein KVH22_04110 [Streptomyces olivaceus]|uniref:hypothetical protein n=1 Tax=Streptomyces TaxID=1883 RepID=UPI0018A86670|nr:MULTISPECIES: hypothetical protein [Streptomyces]MBF8169218.1 hypothetical protein [Streptomyces olivaceus]MBZ6131154.1 hypothetical protein [Streptomyces olivaceus]MBZ6137420.1 hypothetical protein [Streptomyces olivaceus]MBZ6165621.1 hypothetical protein [Streptomyces olivaceus]MBZ6172492.1 hypothetical protein [Streptomyces olivaceus]
MGLVELIARADTRGLAASGLACLDRCLPLLEGDDEILRPLWAALADDTGGGSGRDWADGLAKARAELAGPDATGEDEAVLLARRMLASAPDDCAGPGTRAWADACSVAALRIHRLLDPAADASEDADVHREDAADGASPLVAAELRRQVAVLELLTGHGPAGLRPALETSTEGRRVLRAVVSRRARARC